jgi:hypothetical protein
MAARPGPQAPGSKEIPDGNEECLAVYSYLDYFLIIGPDFCLHWSP